MNKISIALVALVTVAVSGCKKELDFKYHDIDPLTVIEAELTPEGAKVALTYTTPMNEPMDLTRITDAQVILTDLSSGLAYDLSADENGYFTDPTPGIPGHEYQLTVEHESRKYSSTTAMFAPVTMKTLEFNWIKMPYDYVAILKGEFIIDPATTGGYFWVKLYRNGEIYYWTEMDSRLAENNVISFVMMTTRKDTDEEDDDEVLYDGDTMTCVVMPVSRAMHDNLEAQKNNSNGQPMFIGDECLGYFVASTPASMSTVFHPDEIPLYQ